MAEIKIREKIQKSQTMENELTWERLENNLTEMENQVEDIIQEKKRNLQMELAPKKEELAKVQTELEEWMQK